MLEWLPPKQKLFDTKAPYFTLTNKTKKLKTYPLNSFFFFFLNFLTQWGKSSQSTAFLMATKPKLHRKVLLSTSFQKWIALFPSYYPPPSLCYYICACFLLENFCKWKQMSNDCYFMKVPHSSSLIIALFLLLLRMFRGWNAAWNTFPCTDPVMFSCTILGPDPSNSYAYA